MSKEDLSGVRLHAQPGPGRGNGSVEFFYPVIIQSLLPHVSANSGFMIDSAEVERPQHGRYPEARIVTLADLIPSLRGMVQSRLEPGIWPDGALVTATGELSIGGVGVVALANRFGTPLDVVNIPALTTRWKAYRQALPNVEICCSVRHIDVWLLDLLEHEHLSLSVSTYDELRRVHRSGFPGARILLHNNGFWPDELRVATNSGVKRVVLAHRPDRSPLPPWLDGLPTVRIGDEGMTTDLDETIHYAGPRPVGLHCQLTASAIDVPAFERAVRLGVDVLARLPTDRSADARQLVIAGPHAVPHDPGEQEFDLSGFSQRVRTALSYECHRRRIPLPRLIIEPGHGLNARTGLSLRKIMSVRRGTSIVVELDDELASCRLFDGGQHTVRLAGRAPSAPLCPVTVVSGQRGRVVDVALPADVRPGDLIALPCTEFDHPPPKGAVLPALVAVTNESTSLIRGTRTA